MLTQELKDQWCAALRSGRYIQGFGYLIAEGRYCCLGVLAELAGYKDESLQDGENPPQDLTQIHRDDLLGPWSSPTDARVFSVTDSTTHTTLQRKLAAMNDSGDSFTAIADWIEHNVQAQG